MVAESRAIRKVFCIGLWAGLGECRIINLDVASLCRRKNLAPIFCWASHSDAYCWAPGAFLGVAGVDWCACWDMPM